MKILFVQFANSMFPRFGVSDGYFDRFYAYHADMGYWRMQDAFEVPKWIAEVCHFIPKEWERKICYVHSRIDEAIDEIGNGHYDWVLFSVMTCTKGFTRDIIKRTRRAQKFAIGGYDNDIYKMGKEFQNVTVCDTMKETAAALGCEYHLGTDYSLFKGWAVLPRLTLSYGCTNNCKFCIVPHTTSVVDDDIIFQQADSFRDLRFRLVYIDDKTFGQAKNYRIIQEVRKRIMEYNPSFLGFVVQTTSGTLYRNAEEFKDIGVVVAEIGVESYNNHILAAYRKPSSVALVEKAIAKANDIGINVIPNIIVGFEEETEETYGNTHAFIRSHRNDLFGVNFAMYTNYADDRCVGEVDFLDTPKVNLHRKYWAILNEEATRIFD